jgi:hypothetical protein
MHTCIPYAFRPSETKRFISSGRYSFLHKNNHHHHYLIKFHVRMNSCAARLCMTDYLPTFSPQRRLICITRDPYISAFTLRHLWRGLSGRPILFNNRSRLPSVSLWIMIIYSIANLKSWINLSPRLIYLPRFILLTPCRRLFFPYLIIRQNDPCFPEELY